MRYRTRALPLLIVCLLAFGCAPTRHVMVLSAFDGDILDAIPGEISEVEEPILAGRWLLDRTGEVWEFGYDESGTIELGIDGTEPMDVFLLDYGSSKIMFTQSNVPEKLLFYGGSLTGLFQVMREEDGITLLEIDPEWLDRHSGEHPEERWSRSVGDNLVLMTSAESVDRFLREHGQDPDVFRPYGVLRPLEKNPQ